MILEWLDEAPVEVAEDLQMPQFDMYDYKAEDCVHRYKTGESFGRQGFEMEGITLNAVIYFCCFMPFRFAILSHLLRRASSERIFYVRNTSLSLNIPLIKHLLVPLFLQAI